MKDEFVEEFKKYMFLCMLKKALQGRSDPYIIIECIDELIQRQQEKIDKLLTKQAQTKKEYPIRSIYNKIRSILRKIRV